MGMAINDTQGEAMNDTLTHCETHGYVAEDERTHKLDRPDTPICGIKVNGGYYGACGEELTEKPIPQSCYSALLDIDVAKDFLNGVHPEDEEASRRIALSLLADAHDKLHRLYQRLTKAQIEADAEAHAKGYRTGYADSQRAGVAT